jgi:hypothetical protein
MNLYAMLLDRYLYEQAESLDGHAVNLRMEWIERNYRVIWQRPR